MSRQKLSVLIPAGNEEANIADCIASARWADEVVVIDSFSADRTVEIATPLADRVLKHEYINSAAQKNWAIPQMSHPWVLVLDCDERVTPELRREIEKVLARDGPADGYRIRRVNHFLGKRIRGCGWQRDRVLRLFRRDRARYIERQVHADVEFPDGQPSKVRNLRAPLLHYTFQSFPQYLKKFDQYTIWASNDRAKTTGRVKMRHLLLRPAWRFFRQFVLYGGFRDGLHGLVICWMAAHSVFMKYARLWDRQEVEQMAAREKAGAMVKGRGAPSVSADNNARGAEPRSDAAGDPASPAHSADSDSPQELPPAPPKAAAPPPAAVNPDPFATQPPPPKKSLFPLS